MGKGAIPTSHPLYIGNIGMHGSYACNKAINECDDATFEQIKKQLNRFIEVIKVIDLTTMSTHTKEIVFIKVKNCSLQDKSNLFQMCQIFNISIIDYGKDSLILESVHTESRNDEIIKLILDQYPSIIVVRGGSVTIGSISVSER